MHLGSKYLLLGTSTLHVWSTKDKHKINDIKLKNTCALGKETGIQISITANQGEQTIFHGYTPRPSRSTYLLST
jgi:hypothetical protein